MALENAGVEGQQMARLANTIFLSQVAWMATGWFLSVTYTIALYTLLGLSAAVWIEARKRLPDLKPMPFIRTIQLTLGAMVSCYLAVYVLIRLHWGG